MAVVSDITLNELAIAPENVRIQLSTIPETNIEYVQLDEESGELAEKYIKANILNTDQLLDAQHIAIATVQQVDVIVSWNFKHIVNLRRIRMFNAVNLQQGYALLEIRNPREVVEYEEF